MTLDQFCKQAHVEVEQFLVDWKKNQKRDRESFPGDQPERNWRADFAEFLIGDADNDWDIPSRT